MGKEWSESERWRAERQLLRRLPDLEKRFGLGEFDSDVYGLIMAAELQCELNEAHSLISELTSRRMDHTLEQEALEWLTRNATSSEPKAKPEGQ